jgi:hypothetical protein
MLDPLPRRYTVIAVGTVITDRPPHRSVRAQLRHTACMGLFLSRGARSTTFSFFLCFLGPFFCSTRAAGFLPPRPQDAKADARSGRSRTARFFSAAGCGLVLDGREHDGML